MLTNRINVTYNIENIDADFDIFRVEKANKDYYKYNILDSAVYEFKAAAVQWTFGATALVLFRKGEVTEKQFKESIMKEYEDVKIQKIDLFDSEQCNKCFYFENRLLAQLLINSMRTPKHEAFMYNNLTGKLFEYIGSRTPILCLGPTDGDAAAIIQVCKAGKTFEYDDEEGMFQFLTSLLNNFDPQSPIKENNVVNCYSRKSLTQSLTQILAHHED